MNFIQIDDNIVNSFFYFLIGYWQQSIEFHWLKSWQFDSLCQCTLIDDKTASQWACENEDS